MAVLKSNSKFIFGIVLILCGWIICFNLFMLIFGIPFFLLGTILILFSKKSWLTKLLIVGVPIILWFVCFNLILSAINKKEAVTVIVPHDFSGQVRVVYGEKNGLIPEKNDGRTILNIPANGVLIIQPFLGSGMTDVQYYRVDEKGIPVKINTMKSGEDKNVARPAAFFEGTMSGESKDGNQTASLDYIYDAFFVLGNDSAKTSTFTEEQNMNPLTDSLVKVYRGIK
ncbi:hypothetical protein BH11BAC7_BH11BAC7_08770 [soil metagenome]